jgi:predicted transcriptional regulator
MVQQITGIKKLKLKSFLEKNLLKSLNPGVRKGRLYVITEKSRRLLKLPISKNKSNINWELKGWLMASPKQRLVVLRALDAEKRTSEEIRARAIKLNPHLTRISAKGILKELVSKYLAESDINYRKRYYWISDKGNSLVKDIDMRDNI